MQVPLNLWFKTGRLLLLSTHHWPMQLTWPSSKPRVGRTYFVEKFCPLVLITGVQIIEKTQETLQNMFIQSFNNGDGYEEAGERMHRQVKEGHALQDKVGL